MNKTGESNGSINVPTILKVAMPLLQQTGKVFVGPGAIKEAQVIGLGLSKLNMRQKDDLDRAKRYAMEQSIKHVMLKQQLAHQQNQQKLAMYAQALSLMARVYIGSISFEVREEQIKQHFSVFGPVKSINMSWDTVTGHHKGFAFLEYEVPEAALLAQDSMNGKLVGGRNLKVLPVGRPANMPQAQPIIEVVMQEAKDYNRVYVASVHPDLSEQDLKSVFEAFGEITRCQLAKQPGKGHRGFGYLEFKTAQAVKEAIEGMNNFDLGGQRLQVGRCVTPPDALTYVMPSSQTALPTASAVAAAAVTAKIQAQEVGGRSPSNGVAAASPPTENKQISKNDNNYSPINALPATSSSLQNSIQPLKSKRGFGRLANSTPPTAQPLALPQPQLVIPAAVPPPSVYIPQPSPIQVVNPSLADISLPSTPSKKPEKKHKPKKDILSKIKLNEYDKTERATFAPLANHISLTDVPDAKESESNNERLAITQNSDSSNCTALVLREDNREENQQLVKVEKTSTKTSTKDLTFRKKKKVKNPKVKMPKLNTPHALAAAEKAGAINDQIQAVTLQNDEASIASQENVEIRGNDARHLLMHKLMRVNRSSVILLKNMVTADQIDDELGDEIRLECEKYGEVVNIVLAREDELTSDVRVFIRFGEYSQAEAARKALDKRFFDGKLISATLYDQILFEHEDYSG